MNVPVFAVPLDERQHCGADFDILGFPTPLAHAIRAKHEELALALVDLPDQELDCPLNGISALHFAAQAGMLRLAWQLGMAWILTNRELLVVLQFVTRSHMVNSLSSSSCSSSIVRGVGFRKCWKGLAGL